MRDSKQRQRRVMKGGAAVKRLFKGRKTRPCYYCHCSLTVETATFDHVVALAKGGYDKTKNGVIACSTCNSRKGSMSRETFVALLKSERTK